MSEYHAAVGLAELDGWDGKRAAFFNAAQRYADGAKRLGIGDRILVQTGWASSYVLYRARSLKDAERAAGRLSAARLGFRWWYGYGVRREPAYAHLPSDPLPVTDDVAPRLIGLPVWVDIDESTVDAVLTAVSGEDSSSAFRADGS
jgi:dTDP-4-amino-4,6-dideoxygalactose transaminase